LFDEIGLKTNVLSPSTVKHHHLTLVKGKQCLAIFIDPPMKSSGRDVSLWSTMTGRGYLDWSLFLEWAMAGSRTHALQLADDLARDRA
jgi:hypothetical protein